MIRWFKQGPNWSFRGRCSVDIGHIACFNWYPNYPKLIPEEKRMFSHSLQHQLDSGYWIEDIALSFDSDLQVDEGL